MILAKTVDPSIMYDSLKLVFEIGAHNRPMQAIPNFITILACLFPAGVVDRSFSEGLNTLPKCVGPMIHPRFEVVQSPAPHPRRPDSVFACQGESELTEEDPDTVGNPLEFSQPNFEPMTFQRSHPVFRSLGDRDSTVQIPVGSILRC